MVDQDIIHGLFKVSINKYMQIG